MKKQKTNDKELFSKLYHELTTDFNQNFWDELYDNSSRYIKAMVEGMLEKEVTDYVKAERYEHKNNNRVDYRHGHYPRSLVTKLGKINRLMVPRVRKKGFLTTIFKRYKRMAPEVEMAILDSFVNGVSTRNIKRITKRFLDFDLSAQTASNVFKQIDKELRSFHNKPIADKYKYLLIDGIWIRVKEIRKVKKVILVAMGIKEDNTQEIIGFRTAYSESEDNWRDFLEDLKRRGLAGDKIKLIAHDDLESIKNAVNLVYPFSEEQLCIKHKIASVAGKVKGKPKKKKISKDCSKIWKQTTKKGVLRQLNKFINKWQYKEPKAVKSLLKGFELTLSYLKMKEDDWVLIRTTSRLERAIKYFRSRTNNMGMFNGGDSAERIAYCVFQYYNDSKIKKKETKKKKRKTPKNPKEKKNKSGGYYTC